MIYKRILSVFIALGLLAVVFGIAFASDLGSPTYQDGMGMNTATFTPEPAQATSTPEPPQANATATPQLVDPLLQQPAEVVQLFGVHVFFAVGRDIITGQRPSGLDQHIGKVHHGGLGLMTYGSFHIMMTGNWLDEFVRQEPGLGQPFANLGMVGVQ